MKTKDIKRLLKEYFFRHPAVNLRVRQIEREAGAPLPSVIRYTKELEKEGILRSRDVAKVTTYSADRASKQFLLEKKLFNIQQLFSSGLVDFLIQEFNNSLVMLFGSYARGEDIEGSDVDIYIETPKKRGVELGHFEKKLQRKIQVFQYDKITKIKNKELANNIINGIVLNGFIEVFK